MGSITDLYSDLYGFGRRTKFVVERTLDEKISAGNELSTRVNG